MTVRAVEWKQPYTWGTAIEIDENKVISLRLRDENNLIIYDAGDNEIYVDLQLPDELTPTDAFPVWITTGRVIVDNGWDLQWTLICAKTTSGDNIKLLYADEWTLWIDNWTWTFKQIYFKADVDGIITTLTTYINWELARKQNWVTSATAPSNPSEWDLWYDTAHNTLKVYNWSSWVATWGWGGSWDVVVSTDTGNELSTGVALWFWTESDYSSISTPDTNTLYIQYKSDWGGGWQPWVNTLVYMPIDSSDTSAIVYDHSSSNNDFTWYWTADYTTLTSWKRVINLTWSNGIYIDSALVTSQPVTINLWLYRDWNQSNDSSVFVNQQDRWWMVGAWFNNSELASFYDQWWSLVWFNNKYSTSDQTWYNVAITFDSNTLTMYINWTQYTQNSWNNCDFSSVLATSFWFARNISWTQNFRHMTWKMWDLIVESKVRTAQEIADYYDLTKWDYWIS